MFKKERKEEKKKRKRLMRPDSGHQAGGQRAEPELNNVRILYSRGSWQRATKQTNQERKKERERESVLVTG